MWEKIISENITNYYIEKNIINPEMKSIYEYGVWLIINDIISFSMILIISAIIRRFLYGVIFLTVFYFLRLRSGGFHAKKVWICRCTMAAAFAGVILFTYILNMFHINWSILLINVLSVLMMLPIIPVENKNKRLTELKRKKNKQQGIIIIFLLFSASVLLLILKRQEGIVISITMLSVAVLAVIGDKVNKNEERSVKNE